MENLDQYIHDLFTRLTEGGGSAVAFPRGVIPSLCHYFGRDEIESLAHLPDIALFGVQKSDKTLFYSVIDIELITARAQLMPYGAYQMIILDHAESMSITAANKILKLLEDIPTKTLFVLLTDEYDALLPTIRSRVKYYSPHLVSIPLDRSDHIVSQALDAYIRGDIVVYYDLMTNGLKKIESPRSEYLELFDFLIQKYVHRPKMGEILLKAHQDVSSTNLPLRGVVDSLMTGIVLLT